MNKGLTKKQQKAIIQVIKEHMINNQPKPCCKYWIGLYYDGIMKLMKNTEGGHFKKCPECGKKFIEMNDKDFVI